MGDLLVDSESPDQIQCMYVRNVQINIFIYMQGATLKKTERHLLLSSYHAWTTFFGGSGLRPH